MATSSKYNPSSSTPDRSSHTSGHRGSYIASSMERLGSFRESLENPVLSSAPNISRSGSAVTQTDVMSFFQCLRFDPKLLVAELKSNRHVEYTRHIGIAMGISPESSPSSTKAKLLPSPSLEELKRVKASLRESSIKARERIKIFNEGLSVLNKFLPTKKRSRVDVYSNMRSTAFLSTERSAQTSNLSKIAARSQASTGAFELELQKMEERTKAPAPNKRTRTSMVDLRIDGRSNPMVRTSGAVDRLADSCAVQGEDRTLSIGRDGWEKSKMKKKRSIMKPVISSGALLTKNVDGYQEPKQGLQQRSTSDVRSRLHGDSTSLRSGISNGSVGKSNGVSLQSALAMQSSSRTDSDNSSLLCDKKDRPTSLERERLNMKALNKKHNRDESNSASPLSNPKMNASIRAPRSGIGVGPKMSPVVHRATALNDWEVSPCRTNPETGVGAYNRKRTASTRCSSPPVAQWAGQRPQKISRSARRTNFGPIVSNNDDTPILDTVSEVAGSKAGLGSVRRLSGNSPRVKLKIDPLSYTESEDSGVAYIKFRDKGKKATDEMDEKSVQNVQKISTLMHPSRKHKLVSGRDLEDDVRRQGRTGQGFTTTRSLSPVAEKLGNAANVKQLRTAKPGLHNIESKAGRPPTRKLSDRKAYSRQRQAATTVAEFMGDGQEELLAAAHAVISSMHAFPNEFWQLMESVFGFISDADIEYLKQQGSCDFDAPMPNLDANYLGTESTGIGSNGCEEMDVSTETSTAGFSSEQLLISETAQENGTPLCHRLMAALISEDEYADYCSTVKEDTISESFCSSYELDEVMESNVLNHQSPINSQISRNAALNGCMMSGMADHMKDGSSGINILNTGINTDSYHYSNGLLSEQVSLPSISCSESEYSNMNINKRLLLEIQSIGIFPDIKTAGVMTEDDGISENICILEKRLREGSGKKVMLKRLLRSAMDTKEIQEKEFEQRSLDKLVEMAYQKYMSCHRANATGSRSMSNKVAKKAALAFAKWTLDQCHRFEDTGKSCFNEYKEVFLAGCSHLNTGPRSAEGELVKQYAGNAKLSASLQSPSMTSQLSENMDCNDANSADILLPVSCSSDQSTPKEDTWSNRIKRRELLIDDVVGSTVGTHLGGTLGVGSSLVSSTKGKRSNRDREGKGHNRVGTLENGIAKSGQPAISNAKGERKPKTKIKQKTTLLSVSVNGRLTNASDQPKPGFNSASSSSKMTGNYNSEEKTGFGVNGLEDPLDFSQLQLPEMDEADQGQDLGSWLNSIDDTNLQDQDFMGLEIPMDDLSDLNMMY